MINLYHILNIDYLANEKSIQAGIAIYRLREDANDKVVQVARLWLLNPAVRAQYDQKLFAHLGIDPTVSTPLVVNQPVTNYHIDKKLIPTTNITGFEHLYQFLGVHTHASYADIADAIDEAVLEGLNGKTIQLAREHLLEPSARAAYDAEHGIESAAAIVAADEPVATLNPRSWRLPHWLATLMRKSSPSTPPDTTTEAVSNQAVQDSDSTAADVAGVTAPLSETLPTPAPTQAPKPQFKRDNWYHFLGTRGDASFHEIKLAIRQARLKGRDKELIRQAQNMLLKPSNRRLYDKQHNIAAFVAAQNGDIHSKVRPTDYRTAPQLGGISLQKCLLAAVATIGLATAFMPWMPAIQGLRLMLAWPFFWVCAMTLACCASGHKQDPLFRSTSHVLSLALLPAAGLVYLLGYRHYQTGVYWAIACMMGLAVLPWLFSQQARNVSYRAKGQQLFAILALVLNLLWAGVGWWFLHSPA